MYIKKQIVSVKLKRELANAHRPHNFETWSTGDDSVLKRGNWDF